MSSRASVTLVFALLCSLGSCVRKVVTVDSPSPAPAPAPACTVSIAPFLNDFFENNDMFKKVFARQDGDAMITDAGGECNVLVPFMTVSVPTRADNVGTFWASMVLVPDKGAASSYQMRQFDIYSNEFKTGEGPCAKDTAPILDSFFKLFESDCSEWATIFSSNASFYHPKAGHQKGSQLSGFCAGSQEYVNPSQFRANGKVILGHTENFDKEVCLVMVPYVWYHASETIAPTKGNMNSGYEVMKLVPDGSQLGFKIDKVAEMFTRSAVAFDWTTAE